MRQETECTDLFLFREAVFAKTEAVATGLRALEANLNKL